MLTKAVITAYELINNIIMNKQKEILQNIYDVLAHNTDYVSPDEIASNFEMQVDFDTNEITLWGLSGEGTITLKATFVDD